MDTCVEHEPTKMQEAVKDGFPRFVGSNWSELNELNAKGDNDGN